MAQTQSGGTINTNIAINPLTGSYTFTFNDPFNMLIDLLNSADIVTVGGAHNDKFNLLSSSGVTINGSAGNNIYNISASAASLNGNVLKGGSGFDFITLTGGNSTIDLTAGANTGIEAVVGNKAYSGQSVVVSLSQLLSSKLTDGGAGRAFASVIGATGQMSVVETGKFKFIGTVDSAGHGFDAAGQAIVGAALASLQSSVTGISSISGNLAAMYAGSVTGVVPVSETEVSQSLSAYVFSDGVKSYTVWTDGVVNSITPTGTATGTLYQPLASTPVAPYAYNSVAVFNKVEKWAGASLYVDANGVENLRLLPGNTSASAAIDLKVGVTGVNIHGDPGTFGINSFGLGGSGGNNHIFGSKAGNVFDLQLSTTLQDVLSGGIGFDVVKAAANGADIDLTANNGTTGVRASLIDAVVGSSNLANIQTAEFDVNSARYTLDATGAKTAVFEAMLGSTDDTLSLLGSGKWVEVSSFAPGAPLPEHASALSNADILDAQFGASTHKAATSLTGHLFEQVDLRGNAVKFLTVYTDATIDNQLATPSAAMSALAHLDHLLI